MQPLSPLVPMLRLIHPTAPAPDHGTQCHPLDGVRALVVAGARAFTLEGGERLVARSLPDVRVHWTTAAAGHLLASSTGGERLAVARRHGIEIIDGGDGQVVKERPLPCASCSLALDDQGALAVGSHGGIVLAWSSGGWLRLRPLRSRVTALARRGGVIAAGGADGKLCWIEIEGGSQRSFGERRQAVTAIALLPDDTLLAAWADGALEHWAPNEERLLRSFPGAAGPIHALACHDGRILAAGDERLIHRWDTHSAAPLGPLAGHQRPVLVLPLCTGCALLHRLLPALYFRLSCLNAIPGPQQSYA